MRRHLLLPLLYLTATSLAAQVRIDVADSNFVETARGVASGQGLAIDGLRFPDLAAPAALELVRFEVFAPDARIVLHGTNDATEARPPDNRYFRGRAESLPGSYAYLSLRASGEVRGIVTAGGRYWILGNVDGTGRLPQLVARSVPDDAFTAQQEAFSCGADQLGISPGEALRGQRPFGAAADGAAASTTYTARVAVETDEEFLALFSGNTIDATDYIGDVLGFASGIYAAEIATDLHVGFVSLWTAPDPWAETGTFCGLLEFGRYWNDNYGGSAGGDLYTVSHFMSGKSNGGGVAWEGVLCRPEFDYDHRGACSLVPAVDNYGGPFGYSGDLDGDFDIDNPTVVWDIVVVAHEIGHNFDSPHTHCYAGLQGNPDDIDECYNQQSGCYAGPTSLPSGCPGGGEGCGTLMSYCHLLSPGISNIALTLGTGHPYGVEPERVPAQMSDHVLATSGMYHSCLAPLATIFEDGFESGDTSAWSSAVP
jgi:hypothetical protein